MAPALRLTFFIYSAVFVTGRGRSCVCLQAVSAGQVHSPCDHREDTAQHDQVSESPVFVCTLRRPAAITPSFLPQWLLCVCPSLAAPCHAERERDGLVRQLHLPQFPPALRWQPACRVERQRPGRSQDQALLRPLQPGTLKRVWIWLRPGTRGWRSSPSTSPVSVVTPNWPCQSRFWKRGMKPCDSAAKRRRTLKAPRGTWSSWQLGTSCQWSLGVTTLMRADSQASKPFTARKVMLAGDSRCHQAEVFLVAYITPQ